MYYLMIENKGVAPVETFTLLGDSSKRDSTIPGLIGTFGSGSKMGTLTLLRNNIPPVCFCGTTKLEFFTKALAVEDVSKTVTTHKQVYVKFGGTSTKTEKLSWTTGYGSQDWDNIAYALREYVSNAIDAMLMQGVKLQHVWQHIKVEIVDHGIGLVRAKAGYTRIFVPINDGWEGKTVRKFYENIDSWFLHASEPESLGVAVLEKNARNINKSEKVGERIQRAVIYRKGVYVREFERGTAASLFDYNIPDLPMNESRTVDDWDVLAAAGQALKNAKPDIIARVIRTLAEKKDVWEAGISQYSFALNDRDNKTSIKDNWAEALTLVGGENAVVVSNENTKELVKRKGFTPVLLPPAFVLAFHTYGVRNEDQVLTEDDRAGRKFFDANAPLLNTLDRVWGKVEEYDMANGRTKPPCGLFHEHMKAECEKFGYYKDGTVFVHTDYATAENDALDLTVLEEVAHHCSGATDCSRDFQQWLMRFILAAVLK